MNTKLTPGVILLAIVLGTVVGPFTTLKDIQPSDLQSANYWLSVLATGIASLSTSVLAIVGLIAAALGLPILRGKPDEDPPA